MTAALREPLPMTVRLIRPSDMMSKAVITVISETLDNRRSYGKITVLCVCYKSTDLQEGRYSDTSFTFGTTKNTNLAIGDSWPASTGLL